MTPEQLQKTRAERWRQDGNALVTLDDAEEWMQPLGLCLFLPRRVQLATPAPSFVEACLGEANATPPLPAIDNAKRLLTRMVDKGSAIPLNLLGISGEQPDFLVTPEALPYVFALRGDKDWKHEPQTAGNGRVSPLVHGIWKALERTGVQTAVELRESMGKELTEAAVLRGLSELWNAMRVIMLPGEGSEAATWELLKARYAKQMAAGSAMSQVSALSVLLAQYLQSAVGATSEEAEIFLSPLSSRSKVRDVVRGLTATRQLAMIGMDGQAVLYVEGTLPEFAQPLSQVTIEAIATDPTETEVMPDAPGIPSNARKIKKFTKRAPRAPGEPDPLRWKRDSSVPPPAGQSREAGRGMDRGPRPDSRRPDTQGFDRRSTPARPAATRGGAPGEKPAGSNRLGGPGSNRPGGLGRNRPGRDWPRTNGPGTSSNSEAPSRPFSKPGAKPGWKAGAGPASRPGGFASKSDREMGNFAKKPRWVPRDGSDTPNRGPVSRGMKDPRRGDLSDPGRAREGSSSESQPPSAGGSRPYSRPAGGPFKSRSNRPFSNRASSNQAPSQRQGSARPFSRSAAPRREGAGGDTERKGFEKKPRWVPREGGRSRDGASTAPSGSAPFSRSGSNSSRGNRPASPGGWRPLAKTGTGGFKPRPDRPSSGRPSSGRPSSGRPFSARPSSDRPFSGRPSPSGPADSRGFKKKPRWIPREGGPARSGEGQPPNRRGANWNPGSRSPESRPDRGFEDKPSSGRKPGFGTRPGGGSRPASDRAPGGAGPSRGASGRPSGKSGFGGKPAFGKSGFGGKPAFGKKRSNPRQSGPGDFPRRKRPE